MQVLSSPTRTTQQQILGALRDGPQSGQELHERLGLHIEAVMLHLVDLVRQDKVRPYRIGGVTQRRPAPSEQAGRMCELMP